MANTQRVYSGNVDYVPVPVATATAVEKGDMLALSGGLGVVVTAATDNLTLYAISEEAHAANSGAKSLNCVLIQPGLICNYALDAETSVTYGDKLQIAGAQTLKKSDTDPVAWAVETNTTATTIHCMFKAPALLLGDLS